LTLTTGLITLDVHINMHNNYTSKQHNIQQQLRNPIEYLAYQDRKQQSAQQGVSFTFDSSMMMQPHHKGIRRSPRLTIWC